MQEPIEVLMNEHRQIEQVLGSLESFTVQVAAGLEPQRGVLADYGCFFREFADARHHGKEEDILFRRMIERGFAREDGPLAVMYHEHEVGRGHVRSIREAGSAVGPLAAAESALVLEQASAFVPLLRAHIKKEDNILYPMALRLLSDSELDVMAAEFEAVERRSREDGSGERLDGLAERLVTAFRPDPERMAAAAHMGFCG